MQCLSVFLCVFVCCLSVPLKNTHFRMSWRFLWSHIFTFFKGDCHVKKLKLSLDQTAQGTKEVIITLECPLQCDGQTLQSHTPGHILECKKLRSTSQKEDINHIYGTIVEQEIISRVLCKLMRKETYCWSNWLQTYRGSSRTRAFIWCLQLCLEYYFWDKYIK